MSNSQSSRPQPSLADYMAIALSPALIIVLVGSLAFFLLTVFYAGEFESRMYWTTGCFVLAAVLISRISIVEGAERASLFGLALGVVAGLAMMQFTNHPLPAWLVLGVIWWAASHLVWNCTLVDDEDDASGEGLLEAAGLDASFSSERTAGETSDKHASSDKTRSVQVSAAARRTRKAKAAEAAEAATADKKPVPPKSRIARAYAWWQRGASRSAPPGLTVIYFSLAALPMFAIGQKFVTAAERPYAFQLMVRYVAAALGLLLTTSFLGLRRYLRQRRLEMPAEMAGTWLTVGAVMGAAIIVMAILIPRPSPEYAISSITGSLGSPSRQASQVAPLGGSTGEGNSPSVAPRAEPSADTQQPASAQNGSGTEGNNQPGGTQTGATDGSQPPSGSGPAAQNTAAGQNGSQSGGESNAGQNSNSQSAENQTAPQGAGAPQNQQANSSQQSPGGERGDGDKSQASQQAQGNQNQNGSQQQAGAQSPAQQQAGSENQSQQSDNQNNRGDQPKPSQQSGGGQSGQQQQQQGQQQKPDGSRAAPPLGQHQSQAPSSWRSLLPDSLGGGLAFLLRMLIYLAVLVAAIYCLIRYWAEIKAFLARAWRELVALWESLFGRHGETTAGRDPEAAPQVQRRLFASFTDPFASGAARKNPPNRIVQYSFEALEAWAAERGAERFADETPLEFASRIAEANESLSADVQVLASLYARVAYARETLTPDTLAAVERLWAGMRTAAERPEVPKAQSAR